MEPCAPTPQSFEHASGFGQSAICELNDALTSAEAALSTLDECVSITAITGCPFVLVALRGRAQGKSQEWKTAQNPAAPKERAPCK